MDPAPGDVFLFFAVGLIPFLFCILNLILSIKNIKRKKSSIRLFGYITLSWQGLAVLIWIFFIPWLGLSTLTLIAVQGFIMLKTF
jgi:hypothetical protein